MDIHRKPVDMDMDMDMDGKFHIHGKPAYMYVLRQFCSVRSMRLENYCCRTGGKSFV